MTRLWKLLHALGLARRTWSVTDSMPRVYGYKLGRKRTRKPVKRVAKAEPVLPFMSVEDRISSTVPEREGVEL